VVVKRQGKRPSEPLSGDRSVLGIKLSLEDAERLKQAFIEGKLKDLGISNITFPEPSGIAPKQEKWSNAERKKRRRHQEDESRSR
jgi:hypothetical protein